jgi:hypothetical protein
MEILSSFVFIALVVQVITLFLLGLVLGTQAITNSAKNILGRFSRKAPGPGPGH